MGKFPVTAFEYSMAGKQAQDAIQRIRIGAGGLGKGRGSAWRIAQSVSDSKIGDHVQTSRQRVSSCNLHKNLNWRGNRKRFSRHDRNPCGA